MKITIILTGEEIEALLTDYVRQRFNLPDTVEVTKYDLYTNATITFEETKPAEGGDA
jgi:hypothetical protein